MYLCPNAQPCCILCRLYAADGKCGIRQAETKGKQRLFFKAVEVTITCVDIFPVYRYRAFGKADASVLLRIKPIAFIGKQLLRMILILGKMAGRRIIFISAGYGNRQLAGRVHLPGQNPCQRLRPLLSRYPQKQNALYGRI